MNLDKNIRWGILGCGKIAHKFAEDLSSIPNAKLYAVASRNLQKAQDFASIHEQTPIITFGSYEELCKDNAIDVIYIATPHVFHYENTLMCLNYKKAVLCEKPFAMNCAQVKEMIRMAQKHDVFLMEALWTYFFDAPFDEDSRLFDKKLGGGSLLDVGIYPLFAALSILGYPKNISAEAKIGKTEVDETCTIQLDYGNGVTASLFSAITQKTDTTAVIELEKGTIHINSRFHEPSSITIIEGKQSKCITFDVTTNGYNFEAMHVQEMLIQNRTESTLMTFAKSKQLIRLLDTVREKIDLKYD